MATSAFLCAGTQCCLGTKRVISREEKGAFGNELCVTVSVQVTFFHLSNITCPLPAPPQLSGFAQHSTAWSAVFSGLNLPWYLYSLTSQPWFGRNLKGQEER